MVEETDVSMRYGDYTVHYKINRELWNKVNEIARREYGHGGLKKVMGELALEFVKKYDGKVSGLDTFLDPDFVPIPELTSAYTNKVEFLKTQKDEMISDLRDEFYRLHIICKALLDCDDKKKFNMDYVAAWNRYK